MANRFELLNNPQRAMQLLAHWYDIIDTHIMLEIQSEVIYEVLHNRSCNIKWAAIHEQVTMLKKLLSHRFEHCTEVQDDGYISDEDIDKYPETFIPGLHTLLTDYRNLHCCSNGLLHTNHLTKRLSKDLNKISNM